MMFGSKIDALARVARETDSLGGSHFPLFMMENMKSWEREGLVTLERLSAGGSAAVITEKGRKLARKAMRRS